MQNDFFESYLARKRLKFGDKFDLSNLAPQFIPYFNDREVRIEVEFSSGEKSRGFIGITTGWKPLFLLVRTRRSLGSSYTLSSEDRVVRTLDY